VIPDCPSCGAVFGANHTASCTIARCLSTGEDRLTCKRYNVDHCGVDQWGGEPPLPRPDGGTWNPKTGEWDVPPAGPPPGHPNAGECLSNLKGHVCGGVSPRYGTGFDDRGASPLCFECQDLFKIWAQEQRLLQTGQRS
jgi:hypothetical protein